MDPGIPAEQQLAFLLPLPGWPRALFLTSFDYEGGALVVEGATVLEVPTRVELEGGVRATLAMHGAEIALRLCADDGAAELQVTAGGRPALREDRLRVPPTRSAWAHACLALAGSGAGFIASYLYLQKAAVAESEWALKMGNHMAGWHLLLTFTLFPASVWGRRAGIRAVQLASLLFFLIHAGIALANLGPSDPSDPRDAWIALFNAASGLLFLVAAAYGQRAHRDMDPVQALRSGRYAPGGARAPRALPQDGSPSSSG